MKSSSSLLRWDIFGRVSGLLLAGSLATGCAASTEDGLDDTSLDRDASTSTDAKTGDSAKEDDGDDEAGTPSDSGNDVDADPPDGGPDLPDGGGGDSPGDGGGGGDGGLESDADPPDASEGGPKPDAGGPVCGDGKVEGDEECDDGNTKNDDGCDSNCRIETPPTDYATCPGKEIVLTGSGTDLRRGSISGNTSLLTHVYTASCSPSPAGKDAVFSVKPDVDGRLTARVTAASFDEILYWRQACTGTTPASQCSSSSTAHGGEMVSFVVQKNVPYFLFVDSKDMQTYGSFTLEVEVSPGICGNGIIDFGETCDDGNTARGDGCDENCKLEPAPASNACQGQLLTLAGSPPSAKVKSGNVNLSNAFNGATGTACYQSPNPATSKDAVYEVKPAVDGRLVAKVKANFDASIYARSSCSSNTAASQLACSNSQPSGGQEEISFPVQKQTSYWVIVDTHDGRDGLYDLDVTVHPAECGNGVRDGNEECDGDDVPPGFLCDTDCTLWRPLDDKCPGEPLAFFGPEGGPYTALKDGHTANYFDDALSSSCHATSNAGGLDATYLVTPPVDGRLEVTVSSPVFDAILYARSNCNSQGSEIACVNASSNKALEEKLVIPVRKNVPLSLFVDGNTEKTGGPFYLDAAIYPAVCGNGILDGNEECDDGNRIDGDGCSTTCTLEAIGGLDACYGHPLTFAQVGAGYRSSITTSTANLTSRYNPTQCSSQALGPEAIFQITSPIKGTLVASAAGNFNVALYHATNCLAPASACTNKSTGVGPETHSFAVNAEATYYLYVDGITTGGGPSSGTFTLNVAINP